jgi:SAM-dependent methyltransferase
MRRKYILSKKDNGSNYCPICKKNSLFTEGGVIAKYPRPQAQCPNCGSLERHRMLWLALTKKIGLDNLAEAENVLHFAAEPIFENKLRKLTGGKYITADLHVKADVKVDITNIGYPDGTFDFVIASHVLEHIVDDSKAMRELYRVTKKSGQVILLVPMTNKKVTYEDKNIKTKAARLKAFDQDDHVRKYGADFIDRLENAGFIVKTYKANDLAGKKEVLRMSLKEKGGIPNYLPGDVYVCTKKENK